MATPMGMVIWSYGYIYVFKTFGCENHYILGKKNSIL